mgnify:CR=1 FL=1
MAANPYDVAPYPDRTHSVTHPDRLATTAVLFGLSPPDVRTSRVLELGCAGGANLLAMTDSLPHAHFVGIDYSAAQIETANQQARQTGCTNVCFHQMDLLDVNASLGVFDYIVCHGVWSWVDEQCRRAIFRICRQCLSENGVAYISFNAYPGWHIRRILRETMLYHVGGATNPADRIARGREVLGFLVESLAQEKSPIATLLRGDAAGLLKIDDNYLLHEHLEAENHPAWFHDFAAQAAEAGLQYLADCHLHTTTLARFTPPVQEWLRRLGPDVIRREQYIDLLLCRAFRQTLLCRKELTPVRPIDPGRVAGLYISAELKPQGDGRFEGTVGLMRVKSPLVRAAFTLLSEAWPQRFRFDQLLERAQAKLNPSDRREENPSGTLMSAIAQAHVGIGVELYTCPPVYVSTISQRPVAGPFARVQAREGKVVTNNCHVRVQLSPQVQRLVPLLDGTRDQPALLAETGLAEKQLQESLSFLARTAMLIG